MSETHMDYGKIYQYRFQGIEAAKKDAAWAEIAKWIHRAMGNPNAVLDPAAGNMEFLRNIPSAEKWGVDLQKPEDTHLNQTIRYIQGNVFEVELPENHFDGVFMSNFLEHLFSPEQIQDLLKKLYKSLKPGGIVAIMGPNFKYCSTDYFDCADHRLILSHIAVEEHLFACGYKIERSIPKFLPYSFRSKLPASAFLVRNYLRVPLAWKLLGKQFLVFGKK
jgi:SAM-dependent methyltransferase